MSGSYVSVRRLAKGARAAALGGSVFAALWAGACSSGAHGESVASSGQALVGDGLVISQVFGAGGNAKAQLNEDFVELFNRSSAPVSLSGLSLQFGNPAANFGQSADDGGANTFLTVLPDVSVGPGEYFLVGMASTNLAVGAALPTPDFVGPTDLTPQNGKIALARGTDPLTCGTAANRCTSADVVDIVGYGTAADFEGTAPVPALSALTAALREGAGCVDTGQNAADFTVATPTPRNSTTPTHACSGADAGEGGVIVLLDASPSGDGAVATLDGAATDADAGAASSPDASESDASSPDAGESDAGEAEDAGETSDAESVVDAGPPPSLVISQIYTGGGNAGAPYDTDFVELFNRSTGTVSLSGLTLQYAEKAGAFGAALADGGPSDDVMALPDTTLAPGQYFLVGLGTKGTTSGAALPTPDATGTINLAAASGKVAIATIAKALKCGTAANRCTGADVVDLVGYGVASDYQGSGPTGTLSKTTAALRNDNGCTDTRDNAADFTVGAPVPRNSATAHAVCGAATPDAGPGGGGVTDSGAGTGSDSGVVVGEDAGSPSEDSGLTEDSGPIGDDDAGNTVEGDSGTSETGDGGQVSGGGGSGCSCSTLGSAHTRANGMETTGGALFVAAVVLRRRRRRRRGDR